MTGGVTVAAKKPKRKLKGEAAVEGGGLRARLRKREAFEQQDAERHRAKKILAREMKGMGTNVKKLCVFLDDDYFIVGMDDMNLTLFKVKEGRPKLLGYFPKLAHLLSTYLEHRINTAALTKTSELIALLAHVEASIKALEGKKLVPVPAGSEDDHPDDTPDE